MADYYLDSAAVGTADGLTPANAFVNLTQVAAGMSPGDFCWHRRASVVDYTATVAGWGSSTNATPYSIVGWPIAGDTYFAARPVAGQAPWDGDAEQYSTIRYTGAANGAYWFNSQSIYMSRTRQLHASAANYGYFVRTYGSGGANIFEDCLHGKAVGSSGGNTNLRFFNFESNGGTDVIFKRCAFEQVDNNSLIGKMFWCVNQVNILAIDCDFADGNFSTLDIGNINETSAMVVIGGTSTLAGGDMLAPTDTSQVWQYIGVDLTNSSDLLNYTPSTNNPYMNDLTKFSDMNALGAVVPGAWLASRNGTTGQWLTAVTDVVRPGGNDYSIRTMPLATQMNIVIPLMLTNMAFEMFKVLGDVFSQYSDRAMLQGVAGATRLSVFLLAENWTAIPGNDQVCLTVFYPDGASGWASARSVQAVSVVDTWTEFFVDITLGRDGPIYYEVYCAGYEAGAPARGFVVDPVAVLS